MLTSQEFSYLYDTHSGQVIQTLRLVVNKQKSPLKSTIRLYPNKELKALARRHVTFVKHVYFNSFNCTLKEEGGGIKSSSIWFTYDSSFSIRINYAYTAVLKKYFLADFNELLLMLTWRCINIQRLSRYANISADICSVICEERLNVLLRESMHCVHLLFRRYLQQTWHRQYERRITYFSDWEELFSLINTKWKLDSTFSIQYFNIALLRFYNTFQMETWKGRIGLQA